MRREKAFRKAEQRQITYLVKSIICCSARVPNIDGVFKLECLSRLLREPTSSSIGFATSKRVYPQLNRVYNEQIHARFSPFFHPLYPSSFYSFRPRPPSAYTKYRKKAIDAVWFTSARDQEIGALLCTLRTQKPRLMNNADAFQRLKCVLFSSTARLLLRN